MDKQSVAEFPRSEQEDFSRAFKHSPLKPGDFNVTYHQTTADSKHGASECGMVTVEHKANQRHLQYEKGNWVVPFIRDLNAGLFD